jgi:hypothetical protein
MTAIRGNTWIQRLGISKTTHPMIHAVSSRPEETTSTGALTRTIADEGLVRHRTGSVDSGNGEPDATSKDAGCVNQGQPVGGTLSAHSVLRGEALEMAQPEDRYRSSAGFGTG